MSSFTFFLASSGIEEGARANLELAMLGLPCPGEEGLSTPIVLGNGKEVSVRSQTRIAQEREALVQERLDSAKEKRASIIRSIRGLKENAAKLRAEAHEKRNLARIARQAERASRAQTRLMQGLAARATERLEKIRAFLAAGKLKEAAARSNLGRHLLSASSMAELWLGRIHEWHGIARDAWRDHDSAQSRALALLDSAAWMEREYCL